MAGNLGLDEALVSINKSPILEPLEVYHQIDECFGCPLDRIKTLESAKLVDEFVIGTKFKQLIELRNNNRTLCRFNNLNLNNHAHYRIELDSKQEGSGFECSWKTIDKGDCFLCPIAMLFSLLVLITISEKIYSRIAGRKSNAPSSKRHNDATIQHQEKITGDQVSDQVATATATAANRQASGEVYQVGGLERAGGGGGDDDLERSNNNEANTGSLCNHLQRDIGGGQKRCARFDSLDAFRGLTITGMIMVNYGGAGYTFLEHQAWNGLTPADLVFPFFIFSMGASIAMSTRKTIAKGRSIKQVFVKIVRRAFILMALGLCLNSKWLNGNGLAKLRLTGVLQRFSISYLMVALMYAIELFINRWLRAQSFFYRPPLISNLVGVLFELLTAINYLAVYLYMTFYFEYSDTCPAGYTGPGGQTAAGQYADCTGGAAAWLDRTLLGENHMYNDRSLKQIFKTQISHDPEGLLGYTTSILLTLIGLQCGKILVQFKSNKTRLIMFSNWFGLLTLACALIILIPVNKRLWSLTFVTLSGALAYLVLTSLYLLMDVYQCQRTFLLRLLVSAGKNSIFLYVGHSVLNNMLPWHFAVDETSHFQLLARLAWSAFVWLIIAHYMALKRLFIKV